MKPKLKTALIYLFAGLLFGFSLFYGISFFWLLSSISFYNLLVPGNNDPSILGAILIFVSIIVSITPISIYLSRFYSRSKVFIAAVIITLAFTTAISFFSNQESPVLQTDKIQVTPPPSSRSVSKEPTKPSAQVKIISIEPKSGRLGEVLIIKGTRFTKDQNYIKFEGGYSESLNSTDGVTLTYKISDNLISGCGYPNLNEPPGTGHCLGFENVSLKAGSYNISILNINGESNMIKLDIQP